MRRLLRGRIVRTLCGVIGLLAAIAIVSGILTSWSIFGVALTLLVTTVAALVLVLARAHSRKAQRGLTELARVARVESARVLASIEATSGRSDEVRTDLARHLDEVRADLARHLDDNAKEMARDWHERTNELSRHVEASTHAIAAGLGKVEKRVDTLDTRADNISAVLRSTDSQFELRLRLLHSAMLTDMQALSQLMAAYRPAEALPITAGWAMSPSGLLWLTRHIETNTPSTIVECGSGTSTLWCAMALRKVGKGHLTALEHKPEYAAKTRESLRLHGLEQWATVLEASLVPTDTPQGIYKWYDISRLSVQDIELLIVDGPPKSTGRHARYPAIPVLASKFASTATVVADDMDRIDERESVDLWLDDGYGLRSRRSVSADVEAFDYIR